MQTPRPDKDAVKPEAAHDVDITVEGPGPYPLSQAMLHTEPPGTLVLPVVVQSTALPLPSLYVIAYPTTGDRAAHW